MTFKASLVCGGVGLILAGITALSSAQNDPAGRVAGKAITLQGSVTQVEWINPHAWIHLNVISPIESKGEWLIEAAPPNILRRRRLTHETLKTGTEIIVEAYALNNKLLRAKGRSLKLPDGKAIFLDSTSTDGKAVFFRAAAHKPQGK